MCSGNTLGIASRLTVDVQDVPVTVLGMFPCSARHVSAVLAVLLGVIPPDELWIIMLFW